jgi:hypothetical protein
VTSAYPRSIEDLIPQAQEFARELGKLPSQNRLKSRLHVRAERAKAVLDRLKVTGFDPVAASDSSALTGTGVKEPDVTGPEDVPPVQSDRAHDEYTVSPSGPVNEVTEPVPPVRPVRRWPVILLAAPAFVAIWSGWVGVGELTGFGPVRPLPGIASGFTINSAITLPIGMETYAAYALRVWLAVHSPARARRFAKRSAISAFVLGGFGQVAYHLMTAAHLVAAPWPITTAVSCLPVAVLAFGATLAHLSHDGMEVRP